MNQITVSHLNLTQGVVGKTLLSVLAVLYVVAADGQGPSNGVLRAKAAVASAIVSGPTDWLDVPVERKAIKAHNRYSLCILQQGEVSVSLSSNGNLLSVTDYVGMRDAMAKSRSAVVPLLTSEGQAYEIAESVLRNHGLWRDGLTRRECHLEFIKPTDGRTWLAGTCSLTWIFIKDECPTQELVSMLVDGYSGKVVNVHCTEPLEYGVSPTLPSVDTAVESIRRFVASGGLASVSPEQRDQFLSVLRADKLRKAWSLPKSEGVKSTPVYRFFHDGIGVEVDDRGRATLEFLARSSMQPTKYANSSPVTSGKSVDKGTKPIPERRSSSNVAIAVIIVGLTILALLALRMRTPIKTL